MDTVEKDSPALEQLQKCVEALGKAAELGRFQDTEALRSLRVGASTLTPAFDQALREARKAVVDTPTDAHRMALCASEVPDLVRIVSGLAKSADQLLSGVESDLEKRRRELGDAVDPVVVVDSILKSSANDERTRFSPRRHRKIRLRPRTICWSEASRLLETSTKLQRS